MKILSDLFACEIVSLNGVRKSIALIDRDSAGDAIS
jgi:hypothetical protein